MASLGTANTTVHLIRFCAITIQYQLAMEQRYTQRQGQYLAFIYYYTRIHRRAPSEAELQQYFSVSWPSVHRMILTLERLDLVERTPGHARSVRVLLPREDLPDLE